MTEAKSKNSIAHFFHDVVRLFSIGNRRENGICFSIVMVLNILLGLMEGASYYLFLLGITKAAGSTQLIEPLLLQKFNLGLPAYIMFALVLQFSRSGILFIANKQQNLFTEKILLHLLNQLNRKILSLPFSKIIEYRTGVLTSIVASTPSTLTQIVQNYSVLLVNISLIAGIIYLLLSTSATLFFSIFAAYLFIFAIQRLVGKKIVQATFEGMQQTHLQTSELVEKVSALRLIHTYNLHNSTANQLASISRKIYKLAAKQSVLHCIQQIISESSATILVGCSLICSLFLFRDNLAQNLPIVITFIGLVYRLSSKATDSVSIISTASSNNAILDLGFNLLAEKSTPIYEGVPDCLLTPESNVSLKNITFQYPKCQQQVLNKVSLEIPTGKSIAIVGESGAGKSTILDLLSGLYQPTIGSIQVDGQELIEADFFALREQMGVVSQEPQIFLGTIKQNIMMTKPDATDEQFEQACQSAKVSHFAKELPDSYQTVVGERGHRLSGGEKQRIALARALIRKPTLLVLDEATSHLDTLSEWHIRDSIEKLQGKMTMVIVAHRLPTIMHADKIYVLADGKLKESGTHQELLDLNGSYARMWRHQK